MSQQPSLASVAVQNPIFQQAAKKAAFEAVAGDEMDPETKAPITVGGISEEERVVLSKWARRIRLSMLVISTLMIITAFYNFTGLTNSISSHFLAIYIMFFSALICCYEIAFKRASFYIAQNFGFMYTPFGRSVFLMFAAFMCFQLSVMGKVMFALLVCVGVVQLFVNFKHPKFEEYMRSIHFKGGPSGNVPGFMSV